MSNNRIYNVNTIGIAVDSTTDTNITTNFIEKCGNEGISLANGATRSNVTANKIVGAGQSADNTYDGIAVYNNSDENLIVGNQVKSAGATNKVRYGIQIATSDCDNNTVLDNDCVSAATTDGFRDVGTGTTKRNIRGWPSQRTGTATIASGSTSIAVSHGFRNYTPSISEFVLTPTNSLGNATKYWISNVTSTQFTINVNTDPGATTATFAWSGNILT